MSAGEIIAGVPAGAGAPARRSLIRDRHRRDLLGVLPVGIHEVPQPRRQRVVLGLPAQALQIVQPAEGAVAALGAAGGGVDAHLVGAEEVELLDAVHPQR